MSTADERWIPCGGLGAGASAQNRKAMKSSKLLIFIPTYNEVHNVERLCRELNALHLGADILFCDDGSPDGTGEIVDRLAREFPNVTAMHRVGKLGIGSAHQEGIRYGYSHGYEMLLTMD